MHASHLCSQELLVLELLDLCGAASRGQGIQTKPCQHVDVRTTVNPDLSSQEAVKFKQNLSKSCPAACRMKSAATSPNPVSVN